MGITQAVFAGQLKVWFPEIVDQSALVLRQDADIFKRLQAAVLKVKLKAFTEYELEAVNKIYQLYNERLVNLVEVPFIPEGYHSSFAQYTIKLKTAEQRSSLQAAFKEQSIPSAVYYQKPMHKQDAFAEIEHNTQSFAVSNHLCDTVLSLPMHPYLSETDLETICNAIRRFTAK